jgi:hypothetical protein
VLLATLRDPIFGNRTPGRVPRLTLKNNHVTCGVMRFYHYTFHYAYHKIV